MLHDVLFGWSVLCFALCAGCCVLEKFHQSGPLAVGDTQPWKYHKQMHPEMWQSRSKPQCCFRALVGMWAVFHWNNLSLSLQMAADFTALWCQHGRGCLFSFRPNDLSGGDWAATRLSISCLQCYVPSAESCRGSVKEAKVVPQWWVLHLAQRWPQEQHWNTNVLKLICLGNRQ